MDLYIVGCGLVGMTIAERAASFGAKVAIIESRDHIGGNSYSAFDAETGIEYHKYGAHLFHTSNERVWEYVNRFTEFTDYVHRVYTTHRGVVYPLPINLGTINQFFNACYSPAKAKALIQEQAGEFAGKDPKNLEEKAISLIGRPLYEAFIRDYTHKQWQTDPKDLPSDIITRLPVRYNYDNRYFKDKWEGLPKDGYEAWFNKMLDNKNIEVNLNTDFFDKSHALNKDKLAGGALVVYTGPIDKYFDYQHGALGWRTVDLVNCIEETDDFQGCPVMNYSDLDAKFTRIHEFKHFHPERDYKNAKGKTFITKEYSRFAVKDDDPYYPINTDKDKSILEKYKTAQKQEKNVFFAGRLANYKYYDMHMAIASALVIFDNDILPALKTRL